MGRLEPFGKVWLCYVDTEESADMRYVNLLDNPERYTGYSGKAAHKIWDSIYKENCFEYVYMPTCIFVDCHGGVLTLFTVSFFSTSNIVVEYCH